MVLPPLHSSLPEEFPQLFIQSFLLQFLEANNITTVSYFYTFQSYSKYALTWSLYFEQMQIYLGSLKEHVNNAMIYTGEGTLLLPSYLKQGVARIFYKKEEQEQRQRGEEKHRRKIWKILCRLILMCYIFSFILLNFFLLDVNVLRNSILQRFVTCCICFVDVLNSFHRPS